MKAIKFLATVILLHFMSGCGSETEPINYGKDNCSFCKMTILDKKFASEVVTKKGKIFKFDDLSCMVNYLKISTLDESEIAQLAVNDYNKPHKFIDAKKAVFITNANIKSPMAGNTAAFNSLEQIDKNLGTPQNTLVWNDVFVKF